MKKIPVILLAFIALSCTHVTSKKLSQNEIDSLCRKWVPVESESLCTAKISYTTDGKAVLKGETNLEEAKADLVNYVKASGLDLIDSLVVLPDASVGEKNRGLITVSVCNIRRKPAHASELISQALMGTPVKVLKVNSGWYLVQTSDLYIGWVDDDAVSLKTAAWMDQWKKSDRVICTAKCGDITDNRGVVVTDFVNGAILQTAGKTPTGYNVVLPDGREGIISRGSAEDFRLWASHPATDAAGLIRFGKSLLGTEYLWGGISCKGIDCSGFARAIYFSGGMIITRDASSQALYGKDIDITKSYAGLQPGDLLFFGHLRNGEKIITHVGMYIGNGEVIHSSGMVKINSLDPSAKNYSKHLQDILQEAKRFLGEPSSKGFVRVKDHNWYF